MDVVQRIMSADNLGVLRQLVFHTVRRAVLVHMLVLRLWVTAAACKEWVVGSTTAIPPKWSPIL